MEITKEYGGSQQVLYLVTDLIVANVRKRLEFSPRIDEDYLVSVEAKRVAAALLPDEATRIMRHESVRDELVLVAAVGLKRFRALKRYIAMSAAFRANPQTFWKACQWEKYGSAANQKWADVASICEASQKFLNDHLEELTADENMPETFPDLFESDFAAFTLKYNLFKQRLEEARTGTETKLAANNDLYHTVMDNLCLNGQLIFEDSPAISSEYSYEAASQMLDKGDGSALGVKVTQDIDGVMVAMPGVDVFIVGTSIHETTNGTGATDINRLADGPIKVRLVADGYEERLIDMVMDGTRKMLRVVMVPLFEGEMKVGSDVPAAQPVVEKSNQ
jgi:hypothetical protein